MYRIALSPSSFAAEDKSPLTMLEEAGVEVVPNPFGRRLTEAEAIAHLDEIDGLVAGLEPLNRSVLSSAKRLKAIARVGIGMDNVDHEAAAELGILVSNTPEAPSEAVAELTVACALSLARGLPQSDSAMHSGVWEKRISTGVSGSNVLLVGLGRIGRRVAELLKHFGANVEAVDPNLEKDAFGAVRSTTLGEGLPRAQIISLHAGGRDTILGADEFDRMQDGVILLNSARGELVDEQALVRALDSGRIGGAWFDVFWEEPYTGPLTKYPQVLLTPHVGTYTRTCRRTMEVAAVRNVLRDLGITESFTSS